MNTTTPASNGLYKRNLSLEKFHRPNTENAKCQNTTDNTAKGKQKKKISNDQISGSTPNRQHEEFSQIEKGLIITKTNPNNE